MKTLLKALIVLSIITLGSYIQSHAQVVPTDFKVSETTTSTVSLAWTHDGKNVDKFLIERKPLDGNTYTKVSEPKSTDRTFVDTNLPPNSQFQYRIYAVLSGKNSTPTALITGWTLSNAPALSTPVVVSATQINVAWTSNLTSGQFELQYANNANFTNAVTPPFTSSRSYSLTGLLPNTNYYIRVRVSKQTTPAALNYSDWSVTQAKTPDPTPAIPSGLAITGKAETSIGVSWNAVKAADSYEIRYSTDKTFARGVESVELDASKTSSKIINLTSGSTYYIQVRAKTTVDKTQYASGWSDIVSATTDVSTPAKPSILTLQASADGTQVVMNWKDNSSNETGFDIEWGDTPAYGKSASVGVNVTSYTVSGLIPCKTFYVQVRSKNSGGNSDWEPNKTDLIPPLPTAPSELSATTTNNLGEIKFKWNDNSNNEESFELEYDLKADFSAPQSTKFGAGVTTGSLNGLKESTVYYLRIRAKNCKGVSDWSGTNIKTSGKPVAPSKLVITFQGTNQIDMSWTDNSDNETSFEIERSTDKTTFVKIDEISANLTSYSNKGLTPSTQYYYRVRAKNTFGFSDYSNLIDPITLPLPVVAPKSPTDLSLMVVSSSQIDLKWLDNSDNETGFEIERGLDGVNFSKIADVSANGTSYSDKGLTASTKYFYR
ncbi:MAG TPA: hypothetical protein DCM71_13670, partial [Runella sp.]|nr:hypothetical protein [Runella sp.]